MFRLALVVSLAAASLIGCSRDGSSAQARTTTLHFKVQGMHCTSCEEAIKGKLVKLNGVTGCTASHSDGTVDLTTSDPAIAQSALESITALGYTPELVKN